MADDMTPPQEPPKDNIDADGNYIVGKGRPPKSGQFAVDDGRRRGRRPKGQRNFETIMLDEANRKITLREGGRERRVTKLEALIIRAFDNGHSKGQISSIALILNTLAGLMERNKASPDPQLDINEQAIVDGWLERRMAELKQGGDIGDPDELPEDSENIDDEIDGDVERGDSDE